MKKNYNFMIIGVLFMASIITELYFLLEFRSNIALILGGGAIVLLTAYLLFDWLQEFLIKPKNNKVDGRFDTNKDVLEEILKFEKASYLTIHQLIDSENEKNEEFQRQIEIYKEEIIEGGNNAAKLVAKYHREDIKYIIKNLKEASSKIAFSIEKIAEKSTVQEIIDGVTQSIINLEKMVQNIEELLERGVIIQSEYEPIKVDLNDENMAEKELTEEQLVKKQEEQQMGMEQEEQEDESVNKLENQKSEDSNKQMSPEEIAALFASMK